MIFDKLRAKFKKDSDLTEYYTSKNRIFSRTIAQDVMMNMDCVGSWVKDANFRFLDISEQTSRILYDRSSNQCIGLTDYCISKQAGLQISEDQFAEICRASDLYLKGKEPKVFLELITDTKGGKHIWKTIKAIKEIDDKMYYYGFAIFNDVIYGSYDLAYEKFKQELPLLEKINDFLYIYK
jgi:hypothetical protein